MATIAARLPEEFEVTLEEYITDQHINHSAVRKLLAEALEELKVEHALDRLEAGDVTFSRAAELADRTGWELAQLVRERDIEWIGDEDVDADLTSV